MIRGYDLAGVTLIIITAAAMVFFLRWGLANPLHIEFAECVWKRDLGAASDCSRLTPEVIDEVIARFDRMDHRSRFSLKWERRRGLKDSLREYKKAKFGE